MAGNTYIVLGSESSGSGGGDGSALSNGKIWVGNASDQAAEVSVSGDATLSNAGVLSLNSAAVEALCLPLSGGTMTGNIVMANNKAIKWSEASGNGTNSISIVAPANLAADYSLTLPVDDGTANQVLQTDGSGVLSWVTPSATTRTANTLSYTTAHNTSASSSYVTIGDMANQNVVVAATSNFMVTLTPILLAANTGFVDTQLELFFDDTTEVQFSIIEVTASLVGATTLIGFINLTAGTHTVRPRWKKIGGTGAMDVTLTGGFEWPVNIIPI